MGSNEWLLSAITVMGKTNVPVQNITAERGKSWPLSEQKGLQARAASTVRQQAAPPGPGLGPYLELVPLPADAACEARLLDQLLHLLQERRLGHDLALFICLLGEPQITCQEGISTHPPTLVWGPSGTGLTLHIH